MVLGYDLLQALVEVGLQILVVLHVVSVDEFLNFRVRVPLLAVNLVAPNVKVSIGKELGHFRNELFQKLVTRLSRGIHDRIDPSSFQRVGAGTAGEFGIPQVPRPRVAGHIELRHHADAAIMRVGNEVANLSLRIKHAIGSRLGELGKLLALDAESLVIGKMPVQHVHFYRSHAVNVALKHVERDEVAADVDQQAAPGKARLVLDGDRGGRESSGSDLHELKKRLQPAHGAQRGRRRELRSGIGNGQFVRFILPKFLHGFAAVVRMDLQRRGCARFGSDRNPGLPRKLFFEPLDLEVQRSVVIPRDGNRERLIDR